MGGIHERERGVYKEGFLVEFPHPKQRNIVWTCVEDNIIKEKEEYKKIGLCGFTYSYLKKRRVGVRKME